MAGASGPGRALLRFLALVLLAAQARAFALLGGGGLLSHHRGSAGRRASQGLAMLEEPMEGAWGKDGARPPSAFVVVGNQQSGANVGRIVRSAAVFGAVECVVVGKRRYQFYGAHGADKHISFRHFYLFEEARVYLAGEHGCRIYGIEIEENAKPIIRFDQATGVATFPFVGPAAFILGNEGQGLSEKQRAICDDFVYIPQMRGGGGASSLNVACAAAVVLQAFSLWAGYREADREDEAFSPPPSMSPTRPGGASLPAERENLPADKV